MNNPKPDHSYIKTYESFIDTTTLLPILNERDEWFDRPSVNEYYEKLSKLPEIKTDYFEIEHGKVCVGNPNEVSIENRSHIEKYLEAIIPWRKGPFSLFGIDIDAEWRSDWKWDRLKNVLDLKDKHICDIGCNNGFYMLQMLKQKPKFVLGIDPIPKLWFQFQAFKKYLPDKNLFFEMLGVEHLTLFKELFDVVFCMGILYHRKNPIECLIDIKNSMRPGGKIVVESQGIPGNEPYAIFPESTYGKAKNVFFVPTTTCLKNWLLKTGFINVEVLHEGKLTFEEQRKTKWCQSESLEDFTSSEDLNLTIEGYPAPIRILMTAEKKS